MKTKRSTFHPRNRIGTAAIEAALVLPILIIVTFGAIDVAQYINLAQLVSNASREGGRVAARKTTDTTSEVDAAVASFLADSLPHLSEAELLGALTVDTRRTPDDLDIWQGQLKLIQSGEPISVDVKFDFAKIRWLSGPSYWNNDIQESKTYCRRE